MSKVCLIMKYLYCCNRRLSNVSWYLSSHHLESLAITPTSPIYFDIVFPLIFSLNELCHLLNYRQFNLYECTFFWRCVLAAPYKDTPIALTVDGSIHSCIDGQIWVSFVRIFQFQFSMKVYLNSMAIP